MRHACNAKVQNLGLVATAQKNVGRLDVAMHDAACMGVGQGVRNTAHQLGGLPGRGLPASRQRLAQVAAVQPFHRDVDTVARQAGIVNGDDVRMAQAGGCAGLVQKEAVQGHPFRHFHVEVQGLDGHRARQQWIPSFVHLTQATLAERSLDGVAPDVRQRWALLYREIGWRRLTVQQTGVWRGGAGIVG